MVPGKRDLLHLQVQLGLIILHLGMPHPERAAVSRLVAGAVKLAHELGLHQSRTNALFDSDTALLRVRVFWIVYIVDRDISIRTGSPPLQREDDHDIDIPSSAQGGAGLVRFWTASGAPVELDVFATWIRLAQVQGAIYDRLYSVRAEAQPPDVRQRRAAQVRGLLHGWLAAIPEELQADQLAGALPKPAMAQLLVMHFSYLACILHTHRVGSHNAEWVGRLVDYSQRIVGSKEYGPGEALSPYLAPSSGWFEVVGAARECARLFRLVHREDSRLSW